MQTSVARKSTGYPDWHHLATHAMQYAMMMEHDDEGKVMSPKQLIRYFGSRPDWSFLVHGAAWGFLTSHLRSHQLLFSDDPLIRDHQALTGGSSANNGDEEVVLYVKESAAALAELCAPTPFAFPQRPSHHHQDGTTAIVTEEEQQEEEREEYSSNYIPKDTPWVDECHHGYGHGAFMFAVESLARANKPITVEEVCVCAYYYYYSLTLIIHTYIYAQPYICVTGD
jgi:hypothetical protein